MHILLLTKYDSLGASSRVRSLQYLPYLKKKGWRVHTSPLFSNAYINAIYNNNFKLLYAFLGYLNRLRTIVKINSYDIVWVEKEFFPFFPAILPRFLKIMKIPYVVDYDDAIFHRYDKNKSLLVKTLFSTKINIVMRNATTVIVGNDYIKEMAVKVGCNSIVKIPTVVDLNKYPLSKKNGNSNILTIGWIGTPATSKNLELVMPALKKLNNIYNLKILTIGYKNLNGKNSKLLNILPWAEENEVELIKSFDIGIMPLLNEPFSFGKCGYKLIQYMACRLPVVASPIGANNIIVEHGKNGFLADSIDDWVSTLSILIESNKLRKSMGFEGRIKVQNHFSLNIHKSRLADTIEKSYRLL